VARLYDRHGAAIGTRPLNPVEPRNLVTLRAALNDSSAAGRVSLHLVDEKGIDRGSLGEITVEAQGEPE
jgi:hypothetical protein